MGCGHRAPYSKTIFKTGNEPITFRALELVATGLPVLIQPLRPLHRFCPIPELMNCIPRQNEMTYLWNEMARKRNQTEPWSLKRPRATPSKISWRLSARTIRKPRTTAWIRPQVRRQRVFRALSVISGNSGCDNFLPISQYCYLKGN